MWCLGKAVPKFSLLISEISEFFDTDEFQQLRRRRRWRHRRSHQLADATNEVPVTWFPESGSFSLTFLPILEPLKVRHQAAILSINIKLGWGFSSKPKFLLIKLKFEYERSKYLKNRMRISKILTCCILLSSTKGSLNLKTKYLVFQITGELYFEQFQAEQFFSIQ